MQKHIDFAFAKCYNNFGNAKQGGVRVYNYNKLLGRVKEQGYTMEALAKAIGMNVATLSKKVNNKSEFHQKEMKNICELLGIDIKSIGEYFFCSNTLQNQSK